MRCTHCAADEQRPRAYCRQCGKWIGVAPPEERMAVMIIFNALSAVFGAASAIALFSSLNTGAEWPVYFAGAFCIIISVYQTISFLFAFSLQKRLRRGREKDENELDPVRETPALRPGNTSEFIVAPSVTENTTELLESKR
jgi:hypothetical protein